MDVADYKLTYLVRTLSRTKRKDYENYVINAVWNRLGIPDLKPVSQQLIRRDNRHHYLIDLYFPQINVGVECDEAYHQGRREADDVRDYTIGRILSSITDDSYVPKRIDVSQPYEVVEQKIDETVACIRQKVKEAREKGSFTPWTGKSPCREDFLDKGVIDVDDDISFRTIADAVNFVCGTDKKRYQLTTFSRVEVTEMYDSRYKFWFPKLAIDGHAVARGWNNQLLPNGDIQEYNENDVNMSDKDEKFAPKKDSERRITFTRMHDIVTGMERYRFAGIFYLADRKPNDDGIQVNTWSRIARTCEIQR
ncbi:restriction endonuclease [Bifidobacterium pullorum]|uniref:AbaSI family restriction endonuclease n=1 Tax=Bifidobacterium pullorum TaxID=78448 RepID=UPI0025A4C91D|nr:restriction endonuclease [Bifidobacterium pullorum]MDM8322574.1 restriction endonuclease [Bifidobacterium pullorum]